MPDELKQHLNKVLNSKGSKHFFFAYGTGKRKDGKGDGALALAPTKVKKDELQEECACAEFFEGVCWGSSDGDTVYCKSKGKNPSSTVFAKMALTARRVTGQQYSFQIPSEDEEARANNFNEAEGQANQTEQSTETSPGRGKPQDLQAQLKPLLARLIPLVQQAVKTHPDKKNELLRPLAQCQLFIKKNKAAEAKAQFTEIANYLKTLETAPARAASGPEPAQVAAPQDEFKELYDGLLKTVPAEVRDLRAVNAAVADKVQKIVDGAAALARKGGFKAAFEYLNRVAGVIAKTKGAGRAKEAANVIPEGIVEAMKASLSQAQARWRAALTVARARLKPVRAALQEEYPAAAVAVNNILDGYEQELVDELQAGQAKADEEELAAGVRDALAQVQGLRTMAAADKFFAALDEHGVSISSTFAEAFNEIESILQN
jgi:hypothetical protein